jgi:hypothetical protein
MTVEIGKEKSIREEFFSQYKRGFFIATFVYLKLRYQQDLILLLQEKITNTYSTLE